MRPIMVTAGQASLMLAIVLAVSGTAHDVTYIFARRKMTCARVLLIFLFALLAFIFIITSS